MSKPKVEFFEEESQTDRLSRKTKEAPFFPIAVGMCGAACLYGAYMFKRRGHMSPSVFLMQLRVGAQGLAVATLTVGLGYTMYQNIFKQEDDAK
ncbi:hypothetical protein ILUMI_07617 [Ignelater luminosus]|uniref:HIG1 domain-containing protein n=1 Tax=Ignelater luminosus TaxID=2038154 RepID=A0A8K0GGN8_IGNLU|nr:hypothetical protein ILUMI_07617 [Ignelater luminosus]